jgi:phosphoribosylaminoimidazole-succinocarboxamide synthase
MSPFPAAKAYTGHDENVSFAAIVETVGAETATKMRDTTLKLYGFAAQYAWARQIIIADTKFEFGYLDGELILIDEVLTPDSSRFWDRELYSPGKPQASFDKQFVRDYLETLDWNKTAPGPDLPEDVVANTTAKYREAYRRITGVDL